MEDHQFQNSFIHYNYSNKVILPLVLSSAMKIAIYITHIMHLIFLLIFASFIRHRNKLNFTITHLLLVCWFTFGICTHIFVYHAQSKQGNFILSIVHLSPSSCIFYRPTDKTNDGYASSPSGLLILTMKRSSWQRRKLRSSSSSSMRFCSQAFFSRATYRWARKFDTRMKGLYWGWGGSCTTGSAGGGQMRCRKERERKKEEEKRRKETSKQQRGREGRD